MPVGIRSAAETREGLLGEKGQTEEEGGSLGKLRRDREGGVSGMHSSVHGQERDPSRRGAAGSDGRKGILQTVLSEQGGIVTAMAGGRPFDGRLQVPRVRDGRTALHKSELRMV